MSDTHFSAWTAWPGTATFIDGAEPHPRLLELLADLNPPADGLGVPRAPA